MADPHCYVEQAVTLMCRAVNEAIRKHGTTLDHSDERWQSILAEELGEAAVLVNRGIPPRAERVDEESLCQELAQCASISIMRLASALRRRFATEAELLDALAKNGGGDG